ncbi:MAG: outer membrane protein assembly factor BamD [Bacteroidales bacterium]|nr:outer membrane protein assembly factor BamD [Bacteroidales bacterium]
MKYRLLIVAFAAAALLGVGCKSQYEQLLESGSADDKYAAAFDYFNKGKYQRAAQLFESLSMLTSGTERDDTVQYYWGLSNYNQKDFYSAEANFKHFIENFPASEFTESAEFLRIDCLYRSTLRYELDQTPTYTAITAISEYLIAHPRSANRPICEKMLDDLSDRLDRKAYESAKLYYKMEDYKAARVALKNVLKEDSDNAYREEILYYAAMSSYHYARLSVPEKQKERYMVFADDYLNFIGEYPESAHRKELDGLYKKIRNK